MFRKTPLCKGLMLAFGGSVAIGMLPSLAKAQRVEITGSSIRQVGSESALPITVLKTDDLAKAGVTNAEQALAFITSNQSSINSAYSVGGINGGASFADLRGLGPARTLVLINGKRMVNNPYDGGVSAVDVNTIPYAAVERIEILNDGASAIYGSDAVAGVVNFITRREYQGLTLSGSLSQPTTSGGGQSYELGATGGIGSLSEQGWNLFGSIGYRSQAPLKATDRSFSDSAYIPRRGVDYTSQSSFPANYLQILPDGTQAIFNPSLPGCNPPTTYPEGSYCGFNYARYTETIPSQEQWSLMAKGSYAVNKDNTVSLEFLQGNNTLTSVIAPTGLTLTIDPANPFFPGGPGLGGVPGTPANTDPSFNPAEPTYVLWRTTNMGSRTSTTVNKTNRFLLDWQGAHEGWDYSVAALRSHANVTNTFDGGYVNEGAMQAGLSGEPFGGGTSPAPWLNPFGAQTAEGQAYMLNQRILGQVQQAEGTLQGVKADISGQIYKLPAGPLIMAAGIEYYSDKASFNNNLTLLEQTAASGLEGIANASGSRSWTGLFAEFNVPVMKDLEVNLALRYDRYSDFGSTTNPKASVRWMPTKELLVRGSINSGFRAPSLYEAYSPTSFTNIAGEFTDPVLCPGGTVDTAAGGVEFRDCNTNTFDQQVGGNPNLQPETSTAWGIGIVFQPTPSSTVSVDYWNYDIKDSIGVAGESVILENPDKYASNYVRCSALPPAQQANFNRCQIPGGDPVAYIVNTNLNLGTYKTSGLDFSAAWRSPATSYGRFSVGWQATYVLQYEFQLEAGGPYNNNLGNMFSGNAVTRYRQILNFGWQQGPWTVSLINRFTSGYTDQNIYVEPEFYNKVGSVNTWDLAGTWMGMKNLSLTAGLTNMFNQEPPFSNNADGTQVGYDFRYANPIGRAFIMRAVYTF